jgi:acetylornithine deacetylase/succinyl-diaminopimelate desuccinylase-like protein
MWPGAPVIPVMSAGATDSRLLRNAGIPAYGNSGIFMDIQENRIHGKDERVGVKELYDAAEYQYRLVKALAGG